MGKARKSADDGQAQPVTDDGGVASTSSALAPLCAFQIPAALKTTNLGIEAAHTCHPWVMDRLLSELGVHQVTLADGIVTTPSGQRVRLVVAGDALELHDARHAR